MSTHSPNECQSNLGSAETNSAQRSHETNRDSLNASIQTRRRGKSSRPDCDEVVPPGSPRHETVVRQFYRATVSIVPDSMDRSAMGQRMGCSRRSIVVDDAATGLCHEVLNSHTTCGLAGKVDDAVNAIDVANCGRPCNRLRPEQRHHHDYFTQRQVAPPMLVIGVDPVGRPHSGHATAVTVVRACTRRTGSLSTTSSMTSDDSCENKILARSGSHQRQRSVPLSMT